MRKISEKKIAAAIEELNKVRKNWMKRPGVTACDVGYKIKDDKITNDLAIRVHVKRKVDPRAISEYEVFSTSENPQSLGEFPIDVIEAEYAPEQQFEVVAAEAVDRKGTVSPLIGGISVGNPKVTAGTLGAVVYDENDGKACMLSNWHILCGSAPCSIGESIYQPGVYDGGTASDTVATLKRWKLNSDMDAAIAEFNGVRSFTRDILGLSPTTGYTNPTMGMEVVKSGRTTGVTEGVIDGVSASLTLSYSGVGNVTFYNQIHVVPRPPWPAVNYEVSSGGDSGSVWIEESSGKAVGLHFAGETSPAISSEHAIASPIPKVVQELKFSFLPLFCNTQVCFPEMLCIPEMICYPEMMHICIPELICIKEDLCIKLPCLALITDLCKSEMVINPGTGFPDGDPLIVIDPSRLPVSIRRPFRMMLMEIQKLQNQG